MDKFRLSEVNKYVSNRCGQGVPHNAGIKMPMSKKDMMMKRIGHELKENPPKILAKTARKFGKAKAAKQKTAILLSKARRAGAKIPLKSGIYKIRKVGETSGRQSNAP